MKYIGINRNSSIVSYLLVAAVICLVVNFSYLLLIVVNQDDNIYHKRGADTVVESKTGVLSLCCDGFGYILTEDGDSIYVDRRSAQRYELNDGDRLDIEAMNQPLYESAHLIMRKVITKNGENVDYGAIYNGTSQSAETIYQILYYFIVSFILLLVMNMRHRGVQLGTFAKRSILCVLITVVAYFVAPVTLHFSGETTLVYKSPHIIDFIVMMKCLFVLAVVLLYSQIYVLIYQRQQIILENERLKNENLTTRYNMLVSQINPHFFFNSLNSLSMLVREKDNKRALEYIDQLSYTFRYITQNGNGNTLVTVRDELKFAEAYCYLFKIRYADKLFFNIDVPEEYMGWQIPALSLQPLIGNAVKHNAITNRNPFYVKIFISDGCLVVANERRPMLEPQIGTGTGLRNLRSRYNLILDKDIEVISDDKEFVVKLPLTKATV